MSRDNLGYYSLTSSKETLRDAVHNKQDHARYSEQSGQIQREKKPKRNMKWFNRLCSKTIKTNIATYCFC